MSRPRPSDSTCMAMSGFPPDGRQRREQTIDLRRRVRGGKGDAQACRARRHRGRADGGHEDTCSRNRWLAASAVAAAPSISGWMGVGEAPRTKPSSRAPRRKRATRSRSCAPPGSSCAIRRLYACRLGYRRRQRRGVYIGARLLDQGFDEIGLGRNKGAEGAERLAERAHENRGWRQFHIQVLERPAPAFAEHAETVGIVRQQARAMLLRQARQRTERPDRRPC